MPVARSYRSVSPTLQRRSLEMSDLPVLDLNGSTRTSQSQKVEFHTRVRRYLRSVAGALAAAGYTQAHIATNLSGMLVGGETRLCSRRPEAQVRLVVVIEAGAALSTTPGFGRSDGMVVQARWEADEPQPDLPPGVTARGGPTCYFAHLLDSVELARQLLHTVMHEPTASLAHAKAVGQSRRARSTHVLAEHTLVPYEPQSLEDFAKLAMRLEDDMAVEFPDWRYGCWDDLPPG